MVADAAHHLMPSLPQSSVATYLTDRVNNGFNSINFYAVSTCGSATAAAFDGTLPFAGTGPSNYDLSSPNSAYWSEVDSVISQAATDGLVLIVDPAPWGCGFGTTLQNNGATKDFNFGAWLGSRYASKTNIIWHLGQDFNQNVLPSSSDLNLVAQLMAGIASTDPNHLQTVQLNYYESYSTQANTSNATYAKYLSTNFLYTYHETYDYALKAYNASPILPIFLGEANYETADNTHSLPAGGATGQVLRYQMWWTMTSGAAGHEWGNEHVSHFDSTSPTWQSQLDTTATLQVKYLTNLFNQFPWWNLVPDQSHKIVTSGYGTYNTTNENLTTSTYATTAWITDGSLAIVYTPVATTLALNMTNFSKPMNVSWYDPTTGISTTVPGLLSY